jgi:hypothetical protein
LQKIRTRAYAGFEKSLANFAKLTGVPLVETKRISFVTKSIGAIILAAALLFGSSAAIDAVAAAPSQATMEKTPAWKATDLSARRRIRHHYRYGYRPLYRPYYYDRPYYFAPAPFVPFNYGYQFWPWW